MFRRLNNLIKQRICITIFLIFRYKIKTTDNRNFLGLSEIRKTSAGKTRKVAIKATDYIYVSYESAVNDSFETFEYYCFSQVKMKIS